METTITEFNDALNKSLEDLINIITSNKILSIPTNEYSLENILVEENIVAIKNEKYEIIDLKTLSIYILEFYKTKFDFTTAEDFSKNVEFLSKLDSDFCSNGFVHNFHTLEKQLWQLIIKEANLLHLSTFTHYLCCLNKNDNSKEIFLFIDAYSIVLSTLNLESQVLYDNANILLEFTKSDVEYNMPQISIQGSLKQKCKSDYLIGIELWHLCNSNLDVNDSILSTVVAGLYEEKREVFFKDHLKVKFENSENITPMLWGLSNILELTDSDCKIFIDLTSQFENDKNFNFPRLAILISIIKSPNNKFHKGCFDKIKNAISDEMNVYYILNNISHLGNHTDEKTELLTRLIRQPFFSIEKYIRGIAVFFWYTKDIYAFKKIIFALIDKFPFTSIAKGFDSFTSSIETNEFEEFLLELLTDNQAKKRFIGLDIFNELSIHTPYQFTFDILSLKPILQYKLWISLTQDLKEPKCYIPALLPLLNTKYEIVKEGFLCKLEEISEDYGGHLIEVLETSLEKDEIVIHRLKEYVSNFYSKNVHVKNSIKELNPFYTHHKNIKYYNSLFHKKMSQALDKGAKENSFMSLLTAHNDPTILAKGGGWKIANKKEISKLGSIETSLSLPRGYFIDPDEFEMQRYLEMRKDWNDLDFETINNFLRNE